MPVTSTLAPALHKHSDETSSLRGDTLGSVPHDVLRWEELHPWLLDSLQDLQHVADVLAACLSEADEPEAAARLHYALWLNQTALASTETMMDLFAFPSTFIDQLKESEAGS